MSLKGRSLRLSPVAALLIFLGSAEQVRAGQILYASSLEGQRLVSVDTGTNVVTTVLQQTTALDSLAFTPQGNIVYTTIFAGQVRLYNVTTHADTLLASGLGAVQDLTLDPSGTSVLVSAGGSVDTLGNLYRVSLSGGATLIHSYSSTQGLTYDSSGNLFGNVNNQVLRLDPTNGNILQAGPTGLLHLDGLTYDSFTHMLYAGAQFNNLIYAIDPTTLAVTGSFSAPAPDGMAADGQGNLYIASRNGGFIYQYNLTTHVLTQQTFVSGLDDLAPVSGNGAPPAPEPGSLTLIAFGALGLIGHALRRRQTKQHHAVR